MLPKAQWHHVRSKENPADIVSRGCSAKELMNHKLWWHGPAFLTDSIKPWPNSSEDPAVSIKRSKFSCNLEESDSTPTISEVVLSHSCANESPYWDLIFCYFTLNKLLRVTSYCLRFIFHITNKLKAKSRLFNLKLSQHTFLNSIVSKNFDLSVGELNQAKLFWVYFHQKLHFFCIMAKFKSEYALQSARGSKFTAEKIKRLLRGNNALLKLDPFYLNGLMRVGRRLIAFALDFDQKHPIILADKDPLHNFVNPAYASPHITRRCTEHPLCPPNSILDHSRS